MKNVKKIIILMVVIVMTAVMALTGCSTDNSSSGTDSEATTGSSATENPVSTDAGELDTSEFVDLVLYCIGPEYPLNDVVMENFDKLCKEKLNCSLELKLVGWGDISTKYPLLFASGEKIDMAYTSTWLNYAQLAQRGAFMALEDLLPVYAPDIWEQLSDIKKLQATVGGHMYAIPTLYDTYNAAGPIVRGDLMEKYGFDSIDNLEDYGEFMKAVVNGEDGMVGVFCTGGNTGLDGFYLSSKKVYTISGFTTALLAVDLAAGDNKVIQPWMDYEGLETEYLPWANKYADAGCWSPDILANKDDQLFNQGKSASEVGNMDRWATWYINNPDWDPQFYPLNGQFEVLSGMTDALAIASQSENPERALALYNLMCTDKTMFDAFEYGIEGVTCEFPDDKHVKGINQEQFDMDAYLWSMRTNELTRRQIGIPPTWIERIEELGELAVPNILSAFTFDTTNVDSEYANCLNVLQQYGPPLEVGLTDPVEGLQELKEQLEIAGIDKVKAEAQAQLDAFLAANGQ